jgi:O-acetyl-ADP-ribose deacetylase (regulator of RNase III)
MSVQITLVDINPKMVRAWHQAFEDHPEVQIVHGSLLAQQTRAWVSPTNSKGSMDGGVDGAVRSYFGARIQSRVKREIATMYGGTLPVGFATCVPTGRALPAYIVSTPTMVASSENNGATLNVALACCAAFQAIQQHNDAHPGDITSVAIPGLGAGTGRVPEEACADLMWTAYNLFREQRFDSFHQMRDALAAELGELGERPSVDAAKALRDALFAQNVA